MAQYFDELNNVANLLEQVAPDDHEDLKSMQGVRTETGFSGRIFIVYRPTGLKANGTHRAPDVLTQVRLTHFSIDTSGARLTVVDVFTGETMVLGYVPKRLFHYPAFISIPPFVKIRSDARDTPQGVQRSLSYGVVIRTRNRADNVSAGVVYLATPNDFRNTFPEYPLTIQY